MIGFLHSNKFFALSVLVLMVWTYVLVASNYRVVSVDCPWRVSTRGIIHGPDSPYWALTSYQPCFYSERAARDYAAEMEKSR
jgi:hypothetical protein